jgi:Mg/Co/Ni transporter MgtE
VAGPGPDVARPGAASSSPSIHANISVFAQTQGIAAYQVVIDPSALMAAAERLTGLPVGEAAAQLAAMPVATAVGALAMMETHDAGRRLAALSVDMAGAMLAAMDEHRASQRIATIASPAVGRILAAMPMKAAATRLALIDPATAAAAVAAMSAEAAAGILTDLPAEHVAAVLPGVECRTEIIVRMPLAVSARHAELLTHRDAENVPIDLLADVLGAASPATAARFVVGLDEGLATRILDTMPTQPMAALLGEIAATVGPEETAGGWAVRSRQAESLRLDGEAGSGVRPLTQIPFEAPALQDLLSNVSSPWIPSSGVPLPRSLLAGIVPSARLDAGTRISAVLARATPQRLAIALATMPAHTVRTLLSMTTSPLPLLRMVLSGLPGPAATDLLATTVDPPATKLDQAIHGLIDDALNGLPASDAAALIALVPGPQLGAALTRASPGRRIDVLRILPIERGDNAVAHVTTETLAEILVALPASAAAAQLARLPDASAAAWSAQFAQFARLADAAVAGPLAAWLPRGTMGYAQIVDALPSHHAAAIVTDLLAQGMAGTVLRAGTPAAVGSIVSSLAADLVCRFIRDGGTAALNVLVGVPQHEAVRLINTVTDRATVRSLITRLPAVYVAAALTPLPPDQAAELLTNAWPQNLPTPHRRLKRSNTPNFQTARDSTARVSSAWGSIVGPVLTELPPDIRKSLIDHLEEPQRSSAISSLPQAVVIELIATIPLHAAAAVLDVRWDRADILRRVGFRHGAAVIRHMDSWTAALTLAKMTTLQRSATLVVIGPARARALMRDVRRSRSYQSAWVARVRADRDV